jgi:prepilin-type processing-associated H-X9-DG protein
MSTSPVKRIVQIILIGFGMLAVAAVIYPIFANARGGSKKSCISNLKQIDLGNIMYGSDNNDNLPPYFTFEGNENANKLTTVLKPYLKNEMVYLCPQDAVTHSEYQEGILGKMSYVHCLSLKGAIPEFSNGKRQLSLKIPNVAEIPLFRDPIRGFGIENKSGPSGFLSPHGSAFIVAYLDGHVKARKQIDEFKEL